MTQQAALPDTRPTAARPPLLILSVATGYGGAERNIETLLPLLLAERPVTVFACNPLHLQRLRHLAHPALEIHAVDAGREDFADSAARLLVQRFLALRHSAILSNTMDSLRILARAGGWLPGLDVIACVAVHDFLWFDHAQLLPQVPRATLLVPDRAVLEKPDYLARHVWPHGPMRALVMPNPVDIPPVPATALAADAPFLHLATVNPFKGHALLVQAAALLGPRCPDLRIASVGHRPIPELYRELQAQMAEAGAAPTLALHDHVDDPSTLLRGARAVLVTSVSAHGGPETFGRSIIEAWALGRPVIAFACGAPAQLIRHEVDGLLVDEGDVTGLAAAIERLHRDTALADRLGQAGRERARRDFATPRVLAQLTAVLDGAWCPRPHAPPARGCCSTSPSASKRAGTRPWASRGWSTTPAICWPRSPCPCSWCVAEPTTAAIGGSPGRSWSSWPTRPTASAGWLPPNWPTRHCRRRACRSRWGAACARWALSRAAGRACAGWRTAASAAGCMAAPAPTCASPPSAPGLSGRARAMCC